MNQSDLRLELIGNVAVIEISRPPHNFLDADLVGRLADLLIDLDDDQECRAVVLCSEGKSFCAGGDFGEIGETVDLDTVKRLYANAARLFTSKKPIVAAVHGAAIGAGLGLALVADYRVSCSDARLSANFTRLGIHPGFGMSFTIPRQIGPSKAALVLYSARRFNGDAAMDLGLVDELTDPTNVRERAMDIAAEISQSAPLAVQDTRITLRCDLAEQVRLATNRELEIQKIHFKTEDFKEGILASNARRQPRFRGR